MRFTTIWYVRPAKAQTSLRIRAVRSEPLLVPSYSMNIKILTEHDLDFLSLRAISGNFHVQHFCVEKQEKLSGSRLSDHLRFRSIQFSDTLMSDGYFHIFLTDERN